MQRWVRDSVFRASERSPGEHFLGAASEDWNKGLPSACPLGVGALLSVYPVYTQEIEGQESHLIKESRIQTPADAPRPQGPGSEPLLGPLGRARGGSQPSHAAILMPDRSRAAPAHPLPRHLLPSPSFRTTRPVCFAISTRSAPGDGLIDL